MLALLLAFLMGQPAFSESIDGADDPAFSQALEVWLDGNDADSIPKLSALAHDGNTAAQVLLGMIDKTAALQGPYISLLPRAERIALLRLPGGLSGRNWMGTAAESSALAQHWVDLWQMRGGVELARAFVEKGEARASRDALLIVASRTETGFAPEILSAPWYPESLRNLTEMRTLPPEAIADLHDGHPLRQAAGLTVVDDALKDWLQQTPLALHLRAACTAQCPETRESCALALYHGLGSYNALLIMGSPVATLVPEDRFANSPRGMASVARRIMLNRSARMREVIQAGLADIDACAADWLQAEYQRYYPTSLVSPGLSD